MQQLYEKITSSGYPENDESSGPLNMKDRALISQLHFLLRVFSLWK